MLIVACYGMYESSRVESSRIVADDELQNDGQSSPDVIGFRLFSSFDFACLPSPLGIGWPLLDQHVYRQWS